MQSTDQPLKDPNDGDNDRKQETDVQSSLDEQRRENSLLTGELEKLLDDFDRYENKLERAYDEIEMLMFEKKKLSLKLVSIDSKKKENEALRSDFEEASNKVIEQQRKLDEQGQQLEEQDFLIRGLEEEVLDKKTAKREDREKRISGGRKSYHNSKDATRDMTIATLVAELDELKTRDAKSAKSPELEKALEKIEKLDSEKEELEIEVSALKDSAKDLREKVKKFDENDVRPSAKASFCTYEWKLRAETAEKKLESYKQGNSISSDAIETDDYSSQALLLQSVISRQKEKQNANLWGLGGMFAAGKNATNELFARGKTEGGSTGGNMASTHTPLSTFSRGSNMVIADPSDLQAIGEINKSLEEANKKLHQNMALLEKGHKKESKFNQKLIVKLQRDNDKLHEKIDALSGADGAGGSTEVRTSLNQISRFMTT